MQSGDQFSSSGASSVAVLIPTHNRQESFTRIFEIYAGWNSRVLLVDSSVESFMGELPQHFRYLHVPRMYFAEKIKRGALLLDEPYIALCADDDILLAQGLEACVEQLDLGQCGICRGSIGKFAPAEYGIAFYETAIPPTDQFFPCGAGQPRFMGSYSQILWSVYSRRLLIELFELIGAIQPTNDNYIEFIIGVVGQVRGGITLGSQRFLLREVSPVRSWGHRASPIAAEKTPAELRERGRVISALSVFLPEIDVEGELALYLKSFERRLFPRPRFRLYGILSSLPGLQWHLRREVRGLVRRPWQKGSL